MDFYETQDDDAWVDLVLTESSEENKEIDPFLFANDAKYELLEPRNVERRSQGRYDSFYQALCNSLDSSFHRDPQSENYAYHTLPAQLDVFINPRGIPVFQLKAAEAPPSSLQ